MLAIRYFRMSVLAMMIFIAGCGNLEVKDNEDVLDTSLDPTVIGVFSWSLSTQYNTIARCQSAVASLVADGMFLSAGNVDFAIINAGSVRFRPSLHELDFIPAGPVTMGDVTMLLPFDNLDSSNPSTITSLDITGSVIKEIFENAFSRMLADGTEGTSFGRFLQVSYTVRVYADVTKPVGSRITKIAIKGIDTVETETIDLTDTTKTYKVAVPTKYIKDTPGYQDYDEYWDILAQGSNVVDTEIYIYNAVVDVIKEFSPIVYNEVDSCSNPLNSLVITHQ